jgi:hypothetical protein
MAEILSNYLNEVESKSSVGLRYPFGDSFTSFLLTNRTSSDQDVSNLLYYFSVQKKEVFLEPSKGTVILSQVFNITSEEILESLKVTLLEDIKRQIPNLNIRNISFQRDEANSSVVINVDILKNNDTLSSISFGVSSTGDIFYKV